MTITTIDALTAMADEPGCLVHVPEDYLTGMYGPNRARWELDLDALREGLPRRLQLCEEGSLAPTGCVLDNRISG